MGYTTCYILPINGGRLITRIKRVNVLILTCNLSFQTIYMFFLRIFNYKCIYTNIRIRRKTPQRKKETEFLKQRSLNSHREDSMS